MITILSPFDSQTLFLVEVSAKIVVQLNTVNEKKLQLPIFVIQMQRLLSYNFIAQRKCDG